jgi:DNA-binding MarR family transcriptional regulator
MDDALLAIQQLYPQVFHACHRKHTRTRTAPWRVSERDQSLLAHMSLRSARRASDLARHFGIGLPTLSEALKRLERLGYVQRARSSTDRRALALRLTPQGAEALMGTSVLDSDRVRAALLHLTATERRAAVKGLTLLARACGELMLEDSKK